MGMKFTSDAAKVKVTGTVVGGKGYGISHRWDGTVLTVTSDSGTSSSDLRGPAGTLENATTEEKQKLVQEFVNYLTESGDTEITEILYKDIIQYINQNPDSVEVSSKRTLLTITENGDGSYAGDMTFAEVTAAIAAGDAVVAEWHPNGNTVYVLPMLVHEASAVYFQGDFLGTASVYFRLNSDNTVEKIEFRYVDNRDVVSVATTKSGGTVTVTATYSDGTSGVSTIVLDDNDYPVSVTKNGIDCALTWEGFA